LHVVKSAYHSPFTSPLPSEEKRKRKEGGKKKKRGKKGRKSCKRTINF